MLMNKDEKKNKTKGPTTVTGSCFESQNVLPDTGFMNVCREGGGGGGGWGGGWGVDGGGQLLICAPAA